MERLGSQEELRRHREALFRGELADKRDIAARIEEAATRVHHDAVENIYGVEGHALKRRLRDSVAFYLKHHHSARLSKKQIAAYLHCTEEEVFTCIRRAEIELVQRSGSATSADLIIIGQNLGLVVTQLVKTFV